MSIDEEGERSVARQRVDALDRVMRAERRMQTTAQAVDDFTLQVQEFDVALAKKGVVQEIAPGLGSVTVSGSGVVRDVTFNIDNVRTSDAARLGERVLEAIGIAEAKIRDLRERRIEDLGRSRRQD